MLVLGLVGKCGGSGGSRWPMIMISSLALLHPLQEHCEAMGLSTGVLVLHGEGSVKRGKASRSGSGFCT